MSLITEDDALKKCIENIFRSLQGKTWAIQNEAVLQEQLYKTIGDAIEPLELLKEHVLTKRDRLDFFIESLGLVIEVKIKGGAFKILDQCKRYCEHQDVKALLLVSSKYTGWPKDINEKPTYFFHLTRDML